VKLYEAFDDIARANTAAGFLVAQTDYAELFRIAIADRVVRRPEVPYVRVRIYGPLEARLQHVDRVVLGGLVEGVWPPETRPDPWLSRPMRHALGLDLPERRISLSAHDFAEALGADEVVLAYPAKLAGTPTVISRFVQRLAAVAGEQRWEQAREKGRTYLAWARSLDHPARSSAWTSPRRGRRVPRGRQRCRSPRSKTGCAIPTPSTPSIFSNCASSTPSTCPRARLTAASSSTGAERVHQDLCRRAAG
jgi:hypothetical protein